MERMGRGLRKRAPWLLLLGIGLSIAFPGFPAEGLFKSEPIVRAQEGDGYDTEVRKAVELMRRRRYEEALKSFKRANDMRNKTSAECFLGMAESYIGLEAYKNVITSSDKAIEFAGNDIRLQAQAYNLKGIALQTQAEVKDQKKLQEAEAVFRQGIAVGAKLPILHYNLGFTLMQQLRDPEGIAELKKYLELDPEGPKAELAPRIIANPRRAREAYAPEFSITTSEGEYIALDELQGKVVLLDFWGTWCPPCVESVPALRDLNKRYTKEKSFVMIGISSDGEEEKWRAFTAKNQMVWPQYLDRDRKIQRTFEVRLFPTYIIIDHEGIVRYRSSGSSWMKEASLEDAVRKQIKIVAKSAPAE